jgi:hypothetical protein
MVKAENTELRKEVEGIRAMGQKKRSDEELAKFVARSCKCRDRNLSLNFRALQPPLVSVEISMDVH